MPCVPVSAWRVRLSTVQRRRPGLPTTTAKSNRSKYSIENSLWYKGSNQSYVNEWSCLQRPNLNDGDVDHLTYNEMQFRRRYMNGTIPPRDMDEFDDYLYKVKKDVIRKLDACKEGNFRYECTIIYTFVVTKVFFGNYFWGNRFKIVFIQIFADSKKQLELEWSTYLLQLNLV